MCDTLVSLKQNNSDGNITYFAKNSDREPDEEQLVEHYERTNRNGEVKCTHVSVRFEGETNAITISRPRWMWGAEMGANEYGVVIGNEAIFTRRKFEREGLLGMDLLRLGLESGKNAREAMSTIIQYLEEYGQGGSNSFGKREYYDNSFLIADWDESYVLETFGKRWWYSKVGKYGSISNAPFAKREGMKVDMLYTHFGRGRYRSETTSKHLASGNVGLEEIMKIMRMHAREKFTPKNGSNRDICMHAGSFTRKFHTVNSMIVEIGPVYMLQWFTFSPSPCVSLYKPLFFGPGTVWYGSDYWENAKSLTIELSRRDWETYRKAMEETARSQGELNEIVKGAREMISKGEMPDGNYINEIYEKVKEIDSMHLQALRRLL